MTKITALTELTAVDKSDILVIVDDPGGSPVTKKATCQNVVTDTLAGTTTGVTVGTSTLTSGAALDVFGSIVVSDGAGGALQTLQSRELQQRNGSLYGSHQLIAQTVSNGVTGTIVSVPTGGSSYAIRATISGMAKRSSDSSIEIFNATVAKTIGQAAVVSFTSIGNTRGSAFLAAGDFTATDNGTTAVDVTYTNDETSSVTLYATIDYLGR